jgi:hypothetical protein
MKVLISENKLVGLYQKLTDDCLNLLWDIADENQATPDWVDPEILNDVTSIDSITVNNVEKETEIYPGFALTIFKVHVSTILGGVRFVDCFQIYHNIEYYLKVKSVGKSREIQVKIIEDNIERKDKDPQWSMSKSSRDNFSNGIALGPGQYDPDKNFKNVITSSPKYQFGSNKRDSDYNNYVPGPGSYEQNLLKSRMSIKIG